MLLSGHTGYDKSSYTGLITGGEEYKQLCCKRSRLVLLNRLPGCACPPLSQVVKKPRVFRVFEVDESGMEGRASTKS